MPEGMRVNALHAGSSAPFADGPRNRPRVDPHVPRREKHRRRSFRFLFPLLFVVAGILKQRFKGFLAKRTNAFLVAFAQYFHFALVPVDVLPVGAAELANTQGGAVKSFQQRAIAHRQENLFSWNA